MTPTPFTKTPLLFNAANLQKEIGSFIDKLVDEKRVNSGWESMAILAEDFEESSYLSYLMAYFPQSKVSVRLNRKAASPLSSHTVSIIIPLEASADTQELAIHSGECWHLLPDSSPSDYPFQGLHLHIELAPSPWTERFLELANRFTPSAENVILSPSLSQSTSNKAVINRVFGLFSGKVGVNS